MRERKERENNGIDRYLNELIDLEEIYDACSVILSYTQPNQILIDTKNLKVYYYIHGLEDDLRE